MHDSNIILGTIYSSLIVIKGRYEYSSHKWFFHETHTQTVSVSEHDTRSNIYICVRL